MFHVPTALDNLENKEHQYEAAIKSFHEVIDQAINTPDLESSVIYQEILIWVRRVKKQYYQYQEAKHRYEAEFNL